MSFTGVTIVGLQPGGAAIPGDGPYAVDDLIKGSSSPVERITSSTAA